MSLFRFLGLRGQTVCRCRSQTYILHRQIFLICSLWINIHSSKKKSWFTSSSHFSGFSNGHFLVRNTVTTIAILIKQRKNNKRRSTKKENHSSLNSTQCKIRATHLLIELDCFKRPWLILKLLNTNINISNRWNQTNGQNKAQKASLHSKYTLSYK